MVSALPMAGGTMVPTRSRISLAALFVNVTASTRSGGTPWASRYVMRVVMTRVLPLPAPARMRTGPSVVLTP